MKKITKQRFLGFPGNERGSIAIEFAFILPLFLILTLPVVDYGRYILLSQKLVKTASFMADAVAMSSPIATDTTQATIDSDGLYLTAAALSGITNSMNTMMIPFAPEPQGGQDLYQAIITHVYKDASGAPAIGWQYDQNSQSFYNGARESDIGVIAGTGDIGAAATLPASLAGNLDDGENLIVAEVSAQYTPITPLLTGLGVPFLQAETISYTAYYRARYGNLKCIWNVYMNPPACDQII